MFFEKNQAALRQNPQNLAILAQLESIAPAANLVLAETSDGSYTLQVQGAWLHDPKGAETEARQLAQANVNPSLHAKHLLVGLGLGYLLAEVFRQAAGPLFILEPDLPLLRFVLENVDLSAYFTPKVFLSATPKALIHQLKACYISGDPLNVLMLPGCRQRYSDLLPVFQATLEHYLLYAQRERKLLEASHDSWIDVFLQNVPYFHQTHPLEGLRNAFAGKPALVISPGPSLDRSMADVVALKDSMVTLAAGRALHPLMSAGVIPDFVTFVDYMGMAEQLTQLPLPTTSCNFLLTPFVQNYCLQAPARHKFLLQTQCDDHFANWLDSAWQHAYARIEDATNASIFAFLTARWLGCDPIVLVGQDLAFQGDQLYAGGIQAQIDREKGIAQVAATETVTAVDYILSEIRGQDGTMLQTSTQYYVFAKELETLAQEISQSDKPSRLVNASIGGAFLEGFEHLSLSTLRQQEPFPHLDKSELESLPPDLLSSATKQARLHEALKLLLEGLNATLKEAKVLESVLATMLKTPQTQWKNFQGAYQVAKERFEHLLQEHPFLGAALFSKTLSFRHQEAASSVHASLQQAEAYFKTCRLALEEKLIPWAQAAHEGFIKPTEAALPAHRPAE